MSNNVSFIKSDSNFSLSGLVDSNSQLKRFTNITKYDNEQLPIFRKRGLTGDRFIPVRSNEDNNQAHLMINNTSDQPESIIDDNTNSFKQNSYQSLMLETLLPKNENFTRNRFLSFSYKSNNNTYNNPIDQMKNLMDNKFTTEKVITQINPERILDAPNLIDDYYLNLLDWSNTNILAISLANTVYLWNGYTLESSPLTSASDNICSVNWMNSGTCLALGLSDGSIELWDTIKNVQIRTMSGQIGRVCSLSWNGYVLSSGSKDSSILNHDVRIRDHVLNSMLGHNQEVCSLKWSHDGSYLASGGNDNILNIWDINNTNYPRSKFTDHTAAVKAISWCPWQKGLLTSGGGSKDRCIKFWNIDTGTLNNSIDVGSQVCALLWDKHERELISSHGYSKNQICIWKYPSMNKINELNGHMSRVLYLSMSPDGNTIVSGAGDETLRFWKIHDSNKKENNFSDFDFNYKSSSKILNSFQIR